MSYSDLELADRGRILVASDAGIRDPGVGGLPAGDGIAPAREPHGPDRSRLGATGYKRVKAREDTVTGCDDLAASDLARAAIADTENGRRKFERSAASWHQRAAMLRSIEEGLATRGARSRARSERANHLSEDIA